MSIFDGNMPYTNLHELNLDWVMKNVKEIKDKTDAIDEAVEQAETSALQAEESANSITGLFVTPEMYGAFGDGVHDDTVAVQSALENNSSIYLKNGKTYLVDYLTLANKTNVKISGTGKLFRKNLSTDTSILTIDDCSNIFIDSLITDGNILNNGQTVAQNKQSLTIKNSKNVFINNVIDHNPAGDTVYLSNVEQISINNIISESDLYTGRNALSIIRGTDINIDNLININTGYNNMPGGICIEPNYSNENVNRVNINNAYIVTNGLYGFTISNYAHQADISDITVKNCYVEKVERTENRSNACVVLNTAKRVQGNFTCKQIGNNISRLDSGMFIGSVQDSYIRLNASNLQRGIFANGYLTNVYVEATINDIYQNAIQLNTDQDTTSTNNIFNINVGNFALSGSGAGVMVTSGSKAGGIILTGDLSKKTTGGQCLRFEGTIQNIVADRLDMSNWANNNKVYGAQSGSGNFIGYNCKNYNYLPNAPTGYDGYAKGTIVYNTNPTAGGFVGWVCVASGQVGTWKGFGNIES